MSIAMTVTRSILSRPVAPAKAGSRRLPSRQTVGTKKSRFFCRIFSDGPRSVVEAEHGSRTGETVCNLPWARLKSAVKQPDAGFLWFLPHRSSSPGCFFCIPSYAFIPFPMNLAVADPGRRAASRGKTLKSSPLAEIGGFLPLTTAIRLYVICGLNCGGGQDRTK